jgi:hypothetical protein
MSRAAEWLTGLFEVNQRISDGIANIKAEAGAAL